ncbi:glycosyltransferase family 4 protein [Xiamenia xianingshaonis]|uniref:Glycosyltransferase n=1 Tax=Xiamenia xianingshaonis TaxID=2682776 RepID=A0A9E6MPR0_9ACTN|nr:glycosyltransferase family 4 protein [Xiamenia xianingshaonis]NHM13852.1 glycosyltransferase [Xiamenia xianingshaonis]QTU83712.1 glycosyltransferase family 4 protein [Xiamenia xianingshaonis]
MTRPYVIFCPFFVPHLGGVEIYNFNLAKALVNKGESVVVVTSQDIKGPSRATGDLEMPESLTILGMPSRFFLNDRFPLPVRNSQRKKVLEELASIHPEKVVVNTRYYPLSLLGMRYAAEKGQRAVVIDHSTSYLTVSNPLLDPVLNLYERLVTNKGRRYDNIYGCVSKQGCEWLRSFGIAAERVFHNAINGAEFTKQASSRSFRQELALASDDLIVAFTGRLLKEKGVLRVVSAIEGLPSTVQKRLHVVVAGDGPEASTLKRHDNPHIHYVGSLNRGDIAALLLETDVFCFPSTYPEGLPTSLLEAAVCHTAIITSNCGGAREVVPSSDCGIVLESADTAHIQKAVMAFVSNPSYRQTCATNVRAHVLKNFTWDLTAQAIIDAR